MNGSIRMSFYPSFIMFLHVDFLEIHLFSSLLLCVLCCVFSEQNRHRRKLEGRVDVYALGETILSMLQRNSIPGFPDHRFSNSEDHPAVSFSRTTSVSQLLYDDLRKIEVAQFIESKHFDRAKKRTEIQFWLDINEILSCYKNVGSRQWNLSSIWSEFQCGFGECPRNHFTAFPGSSFPINWVKKDNQRSITGSMFSQLDNNELRWSNRNVARDPEFQHDYTYEYNQHMRKEIVQCLSSFVVTTIVFLGIFYNIWNNQLSIINVPLLHKEHDDRLSIWPSLLGLSGFMVFVCAVAVMILVGAPFTSMQKAMFIFLAILMHLQSANSVIEVFVTLVGGLFMAWYSFGKSNHQMK